jgi:hypothetical protein
MLVARGVDDPQAVVAIKTNCATTALGFLRLMGIEHPLLKTKYKIGMAVAWLVELGGDLGILHPYRRDRTVLTPGMLLHYCRPGTNNDHVEWLLGELDDNGAADHGGGGRVDNGITVGHGPVLTNAGRPLIAYWDVPAALEPQPLEDA